MTSRASRYRRRRVCPRLPARRCSPAESLNPPASARRRRRSVTRPSVGSSGPSHPRPRPGRSTEEYADAIKEDLAWLGLHWDRVEKQSDRIDRYNFSAEKLRNSGRLYECFETPVELDLKRKKQLNMGKPPVYDRSALLLSTAEIQELRLNRESHWRFKLDLSRINWDDGILGDLSIDAASVSDPVLIRGDGCYTPSQRRA